MIKKEENSMINKAKAVFCNHPFTDGVKDKPIYIDNNNRSEEHTSELQSPS